MGGDVIPRAVCLGSIRRKAEQAKESKAIRVGVLITPTLQLVSTLLIVGKLITAIGIPVVLLYKEQGAKHFCWLSL